MLPPRAVFPPIFPVVKGTSDGKGDKDCSKRFTFPIVEPNVGVFPLSEEVFPPKGVCDNVFPNVVHKLLSFPPIDGILPPIDNVFPPTEDAFPLKGGNDSALPQAGHWST